MWQAPRFCVIIKKHFTERFRRNAMDAMSKIFLAILKAALAGKPAQLDRELKTEELRRLLQLASIHNVLPLVYEAVCPMLSARNDLPHWSSVRRQVRQQVVLQTVRTTEFLELNRRFQAAGLCPLVVKGIVCRNLYPKPDHRISSDEDVLILPTQYAQAHQILTDYGMQTTQQPQLTAEASEVPYRKEGSPLYIELHKRLFPPESDAYGDIDRFFVDSHQGAIMLQIQGESVYSLGHTDHLLYLICHAFKHFLHSGFGIRQVCDIVLYANAYGHEVNWAQMLENCRQIRAERFAAALFEIGKKHLGFDPAGAAYPEVWQAIAVDEVPLLDDLLSGGVYGGASMSRKHSSHITLETVAAQKQGRKAKNAVEASIFPPASALEQRYPYLRKYPYLIPVAWCSRLWRFICKNAQEQNNDSADALRLGCARVELMRKYGIIE